MLTASRPSYWLRRPRRVGDRLLVIRSKRCMLLEKRNCSTQFHPRCLTKCSTSDLMFEVAEGSRRLTIAGAAKDASRICTPPRLWVAHEYCRCGTMVEEWREKIYLAQVKYII
ncbi:unnamed protein product [Urochloa humidicola]